MNVLNRKKHTVTVAHEGRKVTYRHAGRGFEYIEELLLHPYQPIPCGHLRQLYQTDPGLVSTDDFTEKKAMPENTCAGFPFLPEASPIEVADEQTIQECKLRLMDLIDEEAELMKYHDLARLEAVRDEKSALLDYLKQILSPLGRPRYLHHQQRNDYSAVKQAIQRALKKLEPDFPVLYNDLTDHLEFGLNVCYKKVS